MDDPDEGRTDAQREWAAWAAHGYRKLYQPRSVLLYGGIFLAVFIVAFVTLVWLAANGRLP
jgi:hypothetical protein